MNILHPSKKTMQSKTPRKQGFRLRPILIHSLWMTLVGILLYRLATANTQKLIYVKIFAISGAAVATAPWTIQLLVSTAIIFLYKTQLYDLMWLVRLPPEEGSASQVDEETGGGVWIGNGNVLAPQRINFGSGSMLLAQVDGRGGRRLKRNRSV